MLSRILHRQVRCDKLVRYKTSQRGFRERIETNWSYYSEYYRYKWKPVVTKIMYLVGAVSLPVGLIIAAKMLFIEDTRSGLIDMTGKTVLITGSSSGFGQILAKNAAERGATVIMASRRIGWI